VSSTDEEQDEERWVPDPHLLRVETNKVTDYLLNPLHQVGAAKARFFSMVGFSQGNVEEFIGALRSHAAKNKIMETVSHAYGIKIVVECFMPTPSGEEYCIRTVWNDHQDGAPPRLVTAHPL